MPEYRHDPCSARWVIIAQDRAGRPSEFVWQPSRQLFERCPFCAGNEEQTPEALATYPPSATDWQVRVIPNKYPAAIPVSAEGDELGPAAVRGFNAGQPDRTGQADRARQPDHTGQLDHTEQASCHSPLLIGQPAAGQHEVIIESPRHVASFSELTDEQAGWAVLAYRDRLNELSQIAGLAYGLVFKNCRGAGGATLEHAHSQLLATSILPDEPARELQSFREYWHRHERCLLCELNDAEQRAGSRVVVQTSHFQVYCPYASRFPYETWIVPRHHRSQFAAASDEELREVAVLLKSQVQAMESLFPEVAYNFWFQTAPFSRDCEPYYHWRVALIARITSQAGYEWGSGCFVNPVSPETAAAELRRRQK